MEALDAQRDPSYDCARLLQQREEAFFVTNAILGEEQLSRTIRRLAHEIVENNGVATNLVLIGLLTRGHPIARRIADAIRDFEGIEVPVGSLDIGLYRDDFGRPGPPPRVRPSEIPVSIDGATVVLVDDVLYTGRSIRAALDALLDFGRPKKVRLAVMVDRGHRELPIRPDFVGKNIPTSATQVVEVRLKEIDGEDGVHLVEAEATHA
jgi:pyrimidine operon attenuation protein / uracil phosphoribosyltransferase